MAERAPLPPLRRIAAFGLPDAPSPRPPLRPPAEEARSTMRVAAAQKLGGLALAAVEAGWLELPEDELAGLVDRHRADMVWALRLERTLLRLADRFEGAGVPAVVLKGPAFAHALYPDPSWRPFADLDVLVPTERWRAACAVLAASGFGRDLPEPRPRFDERFGKAASHSDGAGVQVDLHRTLVLGPYGFLMDPAELFEHTVPFELAGRTLRRLDAEATLIHACLHATLGSWPPQPMPLRDVAEAARRADLDWDRVAGLAERWRVSAVVAHALDASCRWLAVEPPEGARAVTAATPSAADRRLLGAYTRRRRRGGMALAAIPHIPGLRGRASYVRAMLVPDAPFLAARSPDGRRPSYLRRWGVPVGWLLPRRHGGR